MGTVLSALPAALGKCTTSETAFIWAFPSRFLPRQKAVWMPNAANLFPAHRSFSFHEFFFAAACLFPAFGVSFFVFLRREICWLFKITFQYNFAIFVIFFNTVHFTTLFSIIFLTNFLCFNMTLNCFCTDIFRSSSP